MMLSVLPRLATDSAGRVFPGVWKPLFLKFPPHLLCLLSRLLYFFLPVLEDNDLLFWVPDVLCQHSEVLLSLLSLAMLF